MNAPIETAPLDVYDALAELWEIYPPRTPDPGAIEKRMRVYARALDDLPPEDLAAVIPQLPRTYTFFPSAAEIRKAVGDYQQLKERAERQMRVAGNLRARHIALQDAFYERGEFDPAAWQALYETALVSDLACAAAEIQAHTYLYQSILTQEREACPVNLSSPSMSVIG